MSVYCQRRVAFVVGVAEQRGWAQHATSGTWLFDVPVEADRADAWSELLERICEDANDALERDGHAMFVRLWPGWQVGPVVLGPPDGRASSLAERLALPPMIPNGWAPLAYTVDLRGHYAPLALDTFIEVLRLQVEAPASDRLRALREVGPADVPRRTPGWPWGTSPLPPLAASPTAAATPLPQVTPLEALGPDRAESVTPPPMRVTVAADTAHWRWVDTLLGSVAAEPSAYALLARGDSAGRPFIGLWAWEPEDAGRADRLLDRLERTLGAQLPPSLVSFYRRWRAGAPTQRGFLWDIPQLRALARTSDRPPHDRALPPEHIPVGETDDATLVLDRSAAFDPQSGQRRSAEMPICRFHPESSDARNRKIVAPTIERFFLDRVRETLDEADPEVRAEPWWRALQAELAARVDAIADEVAANAGLASGAWPGASDPVAEAPEATTAPAKAPDATTAAAVPHAKSAPSGPVTFVNRQVDLRLVRHTVGGGQREWTPSWFFVLPAHRDTPEGWQELLQRLCDHRIDEQTKRGAVPSERFEVHDARVTPIDVQRLFELRFDPDGNDDLDAIYAIAPWYRGDLAATSPLADCWLVDRDGYVASCGGGDGFSLLLLYGAAADGALDDAALERGLAAIYPLPEQAAKHFAARAERIANVRQIDALTRNAQRPPANG